MSIHLYLSRLCSELHVHVLRCPRSLPSPSTCALWEVPLTSPALNTSHSKVIINSPALVGHNQLSRATPTLFIGRQHATSARRGAPRRVPLFKPTPRLETPEKESRTRLLHSHRALRALVFPPYLKLFAVAFSGKWTSEVWKNGAKVRGRWLHLSRSSRALKRSST